MTNEHDNATERGGLAAIVRGGLRLLGLVALWFVLTHGEVIDGWYIGVASVSLAMLAIHWVAPVSDTRRNLLDPLGLVRFVPFFLRRSVSGAVDVARRAFSPSRPLAPRLVEHPLRVRHDSSAAIVFAGVISLLPGTLCARLSESSVTVHVVDRSWPIHDQLEALEARVAAVFGEPLTDDDDEHGGER